MLFFSNNIYIHSRVTQGQHTKDPHGEEGGQGHLFLRRRQWGGQARQAEHCP